MTVNSVEKARRENRRFLIGLFTVGQAIGIALGVLYVIYISESTAKYFHAYVMWVGPGFAFPLLSFSLRLMLNMQYRQIEQGESFNELIKTVRDKEEKVDPVIDTVIDTIENRVIPTIEKAAKAVDEVTGEGELKKALEAIKAIPGKLDELKKSGTDDLMDNI